MDGSRQLCTFFLDSLHFGVPVGDVQEVLAEQATTPVPRAHEAVAGLINLRGLIVPAIDLRRRLQLASPAPSTPAVNIVLRRGAGLVSLLADRIGDVFEVDESLFEAPPETVQGITRALIRGAYKLEEGLLLVLDTNKALDLAHRGTVGG
jgi:purine-binding chemotaxis protein CheW